MTLDEFCHKIEKIDLTITEKALALIWFHDEASPGAEMTAGEVSRMIFQSGLGNPHSTKLTDSLKGTGLLIQRGPRFSLKALSRAKVREILKAIFEPTQPEIHQELGYLPEQVWINTRHYIERW